MAMVPAPAALEDTIYTDAPSAVLIAAAGSAAGHGEVLAGAGFRLRTRIDARNAAAIADDPGSDLVLLDTQGLSDAQFDAALAGLAPRCEGGGRMVAIVAAAQIDLAGALLLGTGVQLLCEPDPAQLLASLAVARLDAASTSRPALHDITREPESVRLQRLNEEVARIADVLARLTRDNGLNSGDARPNGVRDPGRGYRGPEAGEPMEATAHEIRAVIRSRRMRAQFFTGELFADPAWDMLLDLYAARLEDRRVSVSSLCIAAAVPPTTALRWISTMHEAGLFERQADPVDRRRAYIVLSETGLQGMRGYTGAAKRAGLSLA
jgi:hypothetical protein